MRGYGCHHYGPRRPGDGLIGLLIMVSIGLLALPFIGAYRLTTGKDEETRTSGGVMLVIGCIIYLVGFINMLAS